MSFKTRYPDFAAIEGHIRRARVERSVAIASMLSNLILGTIKGTKRLLDTWSRGLGYTNDLRAIKADTFVKRWVN
jgi:hypothetical protein